MTVEPVNGHVKDRRGRNAANAELVMASMTTNLMKLFTTTWSPAQNLT